MDEISQMFYNEVKIKELSFTNKIQYLFYFIETRNLKYKEIADEFSSLDGIYNEKGQNVGQCAIYWGRYSILEYLLDTNKINVNSCSEFGVPLILDALSCKDFKIFEMLVNKNANINIKDGIDENSLFHFAVMKSDLKYANFLLDKGVDFEARNKLDRTPIYYFCINGIYNQITERLLNLGCSILTKNIHGISPVSISLLKYENQEKNILKELTVEKLVRDISGLDREVAKIFVNNMDLDNIKEVLNKQISYNINDVINRTDSFLFEKEF